MRGDARRLKLTVIFLAVVVPRLELSRIALLCYYPLQQIYKYQYDEFSCIYLCKPVVVFSLSLFPGEETTLKYIRVLQPVCDSQVVCEH